MTDWARAEFGLTAYEVFGPNSNTVAPAVALYIGAELTRLGYGDKLQPVDFTIDGIYQPGITSIEANLARLPAHLRASGREYAQTLPASERETVLGTLAEIARDIASDIAETAGRAWNSISNAASTAFGSIANAVESAWNGFTNAVSSAWSAVTDTVSSLFDPIAIDLDGDGIEISAHKGTAFDVDGDGFLEQSAWVSPDDAMLVIDLRANGGRGSGDGAIDQARELSFASWTAAKDTDLAALASLEKTAAWGNGNGKLTAADAAWSELRVWRDSDADGVVDAGELKNLGSHGISEISLGYDGGASFADISDDVRLYGSVVHGLASIVRDGKRDSGAVGDVSLSYATGGWRVLETAGGYTVEFERGADKAYHQTVASGSANRFFGPGARAAGSFGDDRANVFNAEGADEAMLLDGDGGDDKLTGSRFGDRLSGGAGADILLGGGGDDMLFFDRWDIRVSGGAGRDVAVVGSDARVVVDLVAAEIEALYANAGNDDLNGFGSRKTLLIFGGAGDDDIRGGSAADVLNGEDGTDVINGDAGDDVVHGGAGADQLTGWIGDDVLHGGGGNDTLYGGAGCDTIFADAADRTIHGGSDYDLVRFVGAGNIVFDMSAAAVEAVISGAGDDNIEAGEDDPFPLYVESGDGNDRITFGAGDDRGNGGAGFDTLGGASGDDAIEGGGGGDRLGGGDGDDGLRGGEWHDRIWGNDGDDRLRGDEGDDTLAGGGGADRFVFAKGSGSDHVVDFEHGQDRIVFTGPGGPQRFSDIEIFDVVTVVFSGGWGLGSSCVAGFSVRHGATTIEVDLASPRAYALGAGTNPIPIEPDQIRSLFGEGTFLFS